MAGARICLLTETLPRLNLTCANRVFIVELQWNPSVENQAIARAIRLGQDQQVSVIRYIMNNTVEQVGLSLHHVVLFPTTPPCAGEYKLTSLRYRICSLNRSAS